MSAPRNEALALRLDALSDRLRPFAGDPEPVCWVGGDHDHGENYCASCCAGEVEKVRAAHPDDEDAAWEDGGWSGHEEESVPYCGKCGVQLACALTDHGVPQLLEGFADSPPHLDDRVSAETVYEVLAMVDGVWPNDSGVAAAVLAIAEPLAERLEAAPWAAVASIK